MSLIHPHSMNFHNPFDILECNLGKIIRTFSWINLLKSYPRLIKVTTVISHIRTIIISLRNRRQ